MFKSSRQFVVISLLVAALAMAASGGSARADDIEIAPGMTCWGLAEYYTGDGSRYRELCDDEDNRAIIEAQAVSHGLLSSEGGHWIFPPKPDGSNATVLKLPDNWVNASAAPILGSSDDPSKGATSSTAPPADSVVAVPSAESPSIWSGFWQTLLAILFFLAVVAAVITAIAVILLMLYALVLLCEALVDHHHRHYGHDGHHHHHHHHHHHPRYRMDDAAVIKEYYPGGKTAKRRCVIRMSTYVHSMAHFLALLRIAQEDFSGLDPKQVQVVKYAGRHIRTWGIEFVPPAGTNVPSSYQEISRLEITF